MRDQVSVTVLTEYFHFRMMGIIMISQNPFVLLNGILFILLYVSENWVLQKGSRKALDILIPFYSDTLPFE